MLVYIRFIHIVHVRCLSIYLFWSSAFQGNQFGLNDEKSPEGQMICWDVLTVKASVKIWGVVKVSILASPLFGVDRIKFDAKIYVWEIVWGIFTKKHASSWCKITSVCFFGKFFGGIPYQGIHHHEKKHHLGEDGPWNLFPCTKSKQIHAFGWFLMGK